MGKGRFYASIGLAVAITLFFILPSMAATIKGIAYDTELRPLKDVIIEINTTPLQRYVARDGTFLFSLPLGIYNISAYFEGQTDTFVAHEIIRVDENGRYLRDLFLKPLPRKGNASEMPPAEPKTFFDVYKLYFMYGGGILLGLAIIGISYLLITRSSRQRQVSQAEPHKKPDSQPSPDGMTKGSDANDAEKIPKQSSPAIPVPEKVDIDELLKLIKNNGGRMTQKDIRKEIPLSEAKISLMVSELEERGDVKKIKKGRGNIIIIK